jgi:hypothetical protein
MLSASHLGRVVDIDPSEPREQGTDRCVAPVDMNNEQRSNSHSWKDNI